MGVAPSVLLLDDGELDRVQRILERLQADFERLKGREIGRSVMRPRDLLVTSGRRALNAMPRLEATGGEDPPPTWVCLHTQDFLPLRQRLRELGVHFLVQGALDQESLRLFLLQLLYRGAERRKCRRLPLGGEVSYRLGSEDQRAKLAELSREMCRILAAREIAPGTAFSVFLPPALSGGEKLELPGRAVRCVGCGTRPGQPLFSVVLRFDALECAVEARLESVVSGEQIGTRVTPLAQPPARRRGAHEPAASVGEPAGPPSAPAARGDRRREPRHEYRRRVQAFASFDPEAPQLVFAYDLSVEGVRIESHPGLRVGSRVTLALYGGRREEPVRVESTVVRDSGESGIALRFESLTPQQRRQLERLAGGRPPIHSLCDEEGDEQGLVVSRVIRRADEA